MFYFKTPFTFVLPDITKNYLEAEPTGLGSEEMPDSSGGVGGTLGETGGRGRGTGADPLEDRAEPAWAPGPGHQGPEGASWPCLGPAEGLQPPPPVPSDSRVPHAPHQPAGEGASLQLPTQLGCPRAGGQDAEGPRPQVSRADPSGGACAGPGSRNPLPS